MKEQIIAELAGHGSALSAFLKVFIDFAHTHPLLMLASSALLIFASIRNDFSTRVPDRASRMRARFPDVADVVRLAMAGLVQRLAV